MDSDGVEERFRALDVRLGAVEQSLARVAAAVSVGFPALLFPEPVAASLAREQSAARFHEKFFSLLDAGEACLKYVGAIIIALTWVDNQQSTETLRLFRKPVSLGTWASIIQASFAGLSRAQCRIANAVRESLFGSSGKPAPTTRFFVSELVNLRNRERGHGTSRPDGLYEELYYRHAATVHDAMEALPFLRFPLVRVEVIDVFKAMVRYDLRILMGPSPVGRVEKAILKSMVPLNETCLWDGADTLLSLKNLVVYRACPECGMEHTFFLDQATSDYCVYQTYSANHRWRREALDWAAHLEEDATGGPGATG
jgi:hypothetical protein